MADIKTDSSFPSKFQNLKKEKESEDYYELLGCDELNSKEQINAEFKKKALKFHPDKSSDDNRMFQRYQQIIIIFTSLPFMSKR